MTIMKGPVAARKRRRSTPLRCYIVDDHCDALSKIHAAIRNGALPFTDLSVLHFDAHPDLMVTPDMPAATCFRPRELYDTLASAEGGIAEWILPMVYQVRQRTRNTIQFPSIACFTIGYVLVAKNECVCVMVGSLGSPTPPVVVGPFDLLLRHVSYGSTRKKEETKRPSCILSGACTILY